MEFGPEVTGKDQTTKMLLNDQDKVICFASSVDGVTCYILTAGTAEPGGLGGLKPPPPQ